jgi:hypothetical protein
VPPVLPVIIDIPRSSHARHHVTATSARAGTASCLTDARYWYFVMAGTNPGRSSSETRDGDTGNLFDSLCFYISPSLRRDTADVVRRVLTKNGASLFDGDHIQDASHIITDSHTLERDELGVGTSSAQPRIVTVSHFIGMWPHPSARDNLNPLACSVMLTGCVAVGGDLGGEVATT